MGLKAILRPKPINFTVISLVTCYLGQSPKQSPSGPRQRIAWAVAQRRLTASNRSAKMFLHRLDRQKVFRQINHQKLSRSIINTSLNGFEYTGQGSVSTRLMTVSHAGQVTEPYLRTVVRGVTYHLPNPDFR